MFLLRFFFLWLPPALLLRREMIGSLFFTGKFQHSEVFSPTFVCFAGKWRNRVFSVFLLRLLWKIELHYVISVFCWVFFSCCGCFYAYLLWFCFSTSELVKIIVVMESRFLFSIFDFLRLVSFFSLKFQIYYGFIYSWSVLYGKTDIALNELYLGRERGTRFVYLLLFVYFRNVEAEKLQSSKNSSIAAR